MGYQEITIKLPTNYTEQQLRKKIAAKLRAQEFSYQIEKKSLDARKKDQIHWQLRVAVTGKGVKGPMPERRAALGSAGRTGLAWEGTVAIAVGVLSTIGGWGLTRDPEVMYAQSVSQQTMSGRTRQGLGDTLRSYRLAIVATAAGILCLVVAALI